MYNISNHLYVKIKIISKSIVSYIIGRHGGVCWAVCVDVYKVM
jgi:hypothetical protein